MTKTLTVLFFSVFFFNNEGHSSCDQQYKKYKVKFKKSSIRAASSALVSPTVGYASLLGGVSVAATGGSASLAISSSATGRLSFLATIPLTIRSIVKLIKFLNVFEAYRIIQQSEAGMGWVIEDISEQLSEDLNRNISSYKIAELVRKANKLNLFCPTKNILYQKEEIIKYLRYQLM